VKLTTNIHVEPTLRTRGAVPPLLHTCLRCGCYMHRDSGTFTVCFSIFSSCNNAFSTGQLKYRWIYGELEECRTVQWLILRYSTRNWLFVFLVYLTTVF